MNRTPSKEKIIVAHHKKINIFFTTRGRYFVGELWSMPVIPGFIFWYARFDYNLKVIVSSAKILFSWSNKMDMD